ncbi:hypothetical protein NL676_033933 [Syzygium grande]|nr:hypothetical protein NL676_033933 [Syzygium grande]
MLQTARSGGCQKKSQLDRREHYADAGTRTGIYLPPFSLGGMEKERKQRKRAGQRKRAKREEEEEEEETRELYGRDPLERAFRISSKSKRSREKLGSGGSARSE